MPDQPLAEAAEAFVTFSVNGRLGRAGQLLSQHPEIAGYDVRTAIALGDAARFSDELARDPDLPVRRDPRTGWTALHPAWQSTPIVWALIGSSEHRATNPDPDWAATVRILLDTGAETSKITLDPDEPQPSPAVVALLRARGILPPPTG